MDAAERYGVAAMTDQTMRYVSPHRQTVEMVRAGEIGRVFYLQGDYVHDMWSYYASTGKDFTPWRSDRSNPQNILLGGGCHPIDLMLSAVGAEPVEVMCYSNKLCVPEFPADDCYLLSIEFSNQAIGKVHVTSGCSGHGMGDFLEVYGTEGTLSKGVLYRRGSQPVEIAGPEDEAVVGGHGWGGSVKDFLDYLDGRIPNPIPLEEGARTVALCEAALESARTGTPKSVDTP
jgi:predicted dehydrogenase